MTFPRDPDLASLYRIKISGVLKGSWSDWFDGMTVECLIEGDGKPVTTLTGRVIDQSALFGVLNKVRDLNLDLISVEPVIDD